ncbi:MAG: exodeoxyribonuclease VII large subunit [Dehalococcoidia bacterium]|nr:exodeoxyribonuclease VII large subunit [Dehalococcoidia bacterium]
MQALPVSAVVNFLREVLESNELFSDLWIVGEVSNYTRASSGHRYFAIKDAYSSLRTVLFRDTMPGMQLKVGDRILAHGRLTVYPQRGELQFVADFARPEGVGIMAARFEELKLRLGAEGLFDPGRKRALPRFPARIGIVTSPVGAALQDVKNVLARRWPLATLLVAPATVQGEYAPGEIVAALRRLAAEPGLDLAIVARGGGSSEDLVAFNDERVARAIFGFPVPVVAGVGHETDETIADLVADLRAPTPSAAAERATPDIAELRRNVAVLERAMSSATRERIGTGAAAVDALVARAHRGVPNPGQLAKDVDACLRDLVAGFERRCATDRARFEGAAARIAGLDPRATLARGFAIVQDAKTRKVVNTVRKVKPGARLSVAVSDGAFWTEVS